MCRTDGKFTDSGRVFASLMAGGVAGVVSWAPVVPFDVVKSLIQVYSIDVKNIDFQI